jgi:hypothetical protein
MDSKKGLFVLHEGIGSTIFNSQVLEHIDGIQSKGINLDVLCFETIEKNWIISQRNLKLAFESHPRINIILCKGSNIYFPFSIFVNLFLLFKFFKKNRNNYSFIHSRADYSTFLCLLIKPYHKLSVFWDCRGDSISELKDNLSRKGFLIKNLGYLFLVPRERLIAKINSKYSDGNIFVSSELKKIFFKEECVSNSFVIPCLVSEKKFFFDKNLRSQMRVKYSIEHDHKVYLYSGSMEAYQSVEQQLILYRKILIDRNNFLFILTPDPSKALHYFRTLPQDRLKIFTSSFNEINLYYNLADFAILIRDRKRLNWVASPTKFGEYCLAGLPVLMNDNVEQAFFNGSLIGNYISYLNYWNEPFSDIIRESISIKARKFYSRDFFINNYLKLYGN